MDGQGKGESGCPLEDEESCERETNSAPEDPRSGRHGSQVLREDTASSITVVGKTENGFVQCTGAVDDSAASVSRGDVRSVSDDEGEQGRCGRMGIREQRGL